MNILEYLLYRKRDAVMKNHSAKKIIAWKSRVQDLERPRNFLKAFSNCSFSIIAEFKRKSPSEGWIAEHATINKVTKAYEKFGASAISVLTDEQDFGGSLEHLVKAKQSCNVPVMRKDFIIAESQIWESRAHGADSILLISDLLSYSQLEDFYYRSLELDMVPLVEIFNINELDNITRLSPKILGINSRDLRTMKVDLNRALDLINAFPKGSVKIAESGISHPEEIQKVRNAGFNGALIGSALMQSKNPGKLLQNLINTN